MTSSCQQVVDDFGASLGLRDLGRCAWFVNTGKAGPNAALKIVIPPVGGVKGYVLTVARHPGTSVISHEVDILNGLNKALTGRLSESVPKVLVHSAAGGTVYFGVPFYESHGHGRLARRLTRTRRFEWIVRWLIELGCCTGQNRFTQEWLEGFATTISRIHADPYVSNAVKQQVQGSFDTMSSGLDKIPSVCCHGDLWSDNILWKRSLRTAVVLDWGAACWPGLPGVDLCRYALSCCTIGEQVTRAIRKYCLAVGLEAALVPALYDMYNVFIKAQLDEAYATQPHDRFDPFHGVDGLPSSRLSQLLSAHSTT